MTIKKARELKRGDVTTTGKVVDVCGFQLPNDTEPKLAILCEGGRWFPCESGDDRVEVESPTVKARDVKEGVTVKIPNRSDPLTVAKSESSGPDVLIAGYLSGWVAYWVCVDGDHEFEVVPHHQPHRGTGDSRGMEMIVPNNILPEYLGRRAGDIDGRTFITNGAVMLMDCQFQDPVRELAKGTGKDFLEKQYDAVSIESISALDVVVRFSHGAQVDRKYVHLVEDMWGRRGLWQGVCDNPDDAVSYRVDGDIAAVVMPLRRDEPTR